MKTDMPAELRRPVTWKAFPEESWWEEFEQTAELHWVKEMTRRAQRLVWIREAPDQELPNGETVTWLALDRQICAARPEYFLDHYGWVKDFSAAPKRRQVPFVMWPEQRRLLRWVTKRNAQHKRSLVPDKPREVGATWLMLQGVILHRWLFEQNFEALIGSRNADAVDYLGDEGSLFQRMRWVLDNLPAHLLPGGRRDWRDIEKDALDKARFLKNPDTGSTVTGEKVTPGFGKGKRKSFVFIDEAADIENAIAAQMWGSLESVGAMLWMWNPGSNAGHITRRLSHGTERLPAAPEEMIFRFLPPKDENGVRDPSKGWKADPRRPPDFIARKSADIGEDYAAQQYEGKAGAVVTGRVLEVRVDDLLYGDEFLDEIRQGFRGSCTVLNAWDFGSGAQSALVSVFGVVDIWSGREPSLYVDQEGYWLQTAAEDAGSDWNNQAALYGGELIATGDPAGRAKESDQMSWEDRLRLQGVPLTVYDNDGWVNSLEWKHLKIRAFLKLVDEGRLRVHRRCRYLIDCIKHWSWAGIKAGADIAYIDRQAWRPRKDRWGHGGDTLLYLVEAFETRAGTWAPSVSAMTSLPKTPLGNQRRRRRELSGAFF